MCEPREIPQRVQIGEFGQIVGRQDQGCQVGQRGREGGLYAVDAVAREEEGPEARGEGKVGEGGDVVVGEVDGVLVLQRDCSAMNVLSKILVLVERERGRKRGGNEGGEEKEEKVG